MSPRKVDFCRDVLLVKSDALDEDVAEYLTTYVFDTLKLTGSTLVTMDFARDLYDLCDAYSEGSASLFAKDEEGARARLEKFVLAGTAKEEEREEKVNEALSFSPPSSVQSSEEISESGGKLIEPSSTAYDDERLSILRGLIPVDVINAEINHDLDELLTHLLDAMSMGSMEDAARSLLEAETPQGSLNELRKEYESCRKNAERQKEQDRLKAIEVKRRTLNRFDLEREPGTAATSSASGTGSNAKACKGGIKYAGEAEKSKIRFLEGKVVGTKGEKFIVENLKEEWDGGSKGRIKTKGKRGSGWAT